MSVHQVQDKAGCWVGVGDRIAAAFRRSTTPELRLGKVVDVVLGEKDALGTAQVFLDVEWETDGYAWAVKRSKIRVSLRRFALVEKAVLT